jgi:hypothetical protein
MTGVSYCAFGTVLTGVFPDAACGAELTEGLPAHWERCDGRAAVRTFRIQRSGDVSGESRYDLIDGDTPVIEGADTRRTAALLHGLFEYYVAEYATTHAFFHAGVVVRHGKAILMPGPSRAGKTTLAAALVRAGAGYGDDDLAAVDRNGCVRAMARPPRLRPDVATDYALPATLAGTAVADPVPVAAVLVLAYRPGPVLELRPLDRGGAAIRLVANCLNARHDPDLALRHAAAAVRGAWCGEGLRGDAVEAAAQILDRIDNLDLTRSAV